MAKEKMPDLKSMLPKGKVKMGGGGKIQRVPTPEKPKEKPVKKGFDTKDIV